MKQFFKKFLAKFRNGAFLAIAAMLFVGSMIAGMQFHSKAGAVASNENVEYFLKMDDFPGESTDKGHLSEINLTSYAWGKDAPGLKQGTATVGGGGGAGKVQLQDFHFTTNVNKSSPKLMAACASGKHFKEAILTARKKGQGQQDFLTVKLQDVVISSYRSSGPSNGAPVDEFSVSFGRAEFSYTPLKADGSSDEPVVGVVDARGDAAL